MGREPRKLNDAKALVPWAAAAFLANEDPEFIRLYVTVKVGAERAEEVITEGRAAAEETRHAAFAGDRPSIHKWIEARLAKR